MVGNALIVELKSIDTLGPQQRMQLLAYLRASGLPAGFLINFNEARLVDGCEWFVHPRYLKRASRIPGSDVPVVPEVLDAVENKQQD